MAKIKYNPNEMLPIVEECAGRGYTDIELCKKLGIGHTAFYDYQNKYPEFKTAIKRGKRIADDKVEQKLYKRALGYRYTEVTKEPVKVFDEDGNEVGVSKKLHVTKKVTKHLPPDVTAIRLFLLNRKPEEWQDRQNLNVNHDGFIPQTFAEWVKFNANKRKGNNGVSE